jgi:hypothetical protein
MISQVMPSCFSIKTVSYFFVVTVFLLRLQIRYHVPPMARGLPALRPLG